MDGQEWLRSQLTGFSCVSCGQSYLRSRIRLLAQREDLWFVSLKCVACGASALGLVTVREAEGAEPEVHLAAYGEFTAEDEARFAASPPVGADDLLEMHRFLDDFSGNFRAYLARPEER